MSKICLVGHSHIDAVYIWDRKEAKEVGGVKYTEWGIEGSKWELNDKKFKDTYDILNYDPLKDKESKILRKDYIQDILRIKDENQEIMGNSALVSGVYYTTLFMFPLILFNWDLFLFYAMDNKKDFLEKIKAFAEISVRNVNMWVDNGCEVFVSHDDLALTKGLVFNKEWYQEYIFPFYREIWKPIKEKGIPLLFVSDGKYYELIDDLVDLGVDGFFIDQNNDLGSIVSKYGGKKVLIGNINTAILTFGRENDIKEEIKRVLKISDGINGYFLKASGELPHNIPISNLRLYFKEIERARQDYRLLLGN